jgi:SAM-dependent methyltransferase
MQPPHEPAAAGLGTGPSLSRGRLLLISIVSLYLELMLIRWLPTQVRILAYFNNVILISCILGLGLGALMAPRRTPRALSPVLLLAALMVLALLYHGLGVRLPLANADYFLWNGLSRAATGTAWQYVALFLFFALNTALLVPVGQILGREFDAQPPLYAYLLNVAGALVGICLFAFFSLFSLPPVWWFGVGLLLLLPLLRLDGPTVAGAVLVLALAGAGLLEPDTYWSPYYRITTQEITLDGRVAGHEVRVNEDSHQQAFDLSGRYDSIQELRTRRAIYDEPYRFRRPDTVLVLGAGTGNDVAAALRAGARYVDAVEIDPVILSLGRTLHPERPYDEPRVHQWNAEARTFLRRTPRRYDAIVLGYVDSHSLFSAMSSVRLDNFLYTAEAFEELRRHLTADGILAVTFTVHEQWIADRLHGLMTRTFGTPPLAFQGAKSSSSGTVFLGGPVVTHQQVTYMPYHPGKPTSDGSHTWIYEDNAEGYLAPTVFSRGADLPTDDWPYLYLRVPSVPANYLLCMLGLLVLSGVTVVRTTGLRRVRWGFFFLGAAFLLVETKAMTELAIFLGSTWTVNFFVIATVLLLIMLGTFWVLRSRLPTTRAAYLGLVGVLLGTYAVPVHGLLGWDSPLRDVVAVILLCLPLFAAAIIFARQLATEPEPSAALGSNLLGALAGGVLEYSSMAYGLRSLYVLALLLYLCSWLAFGRGAARASVA